MRKSLLIASIFISLLVTSQSIAGPLSGGSPFSNLRATYQDIINALTAKPLPVANGGSAWVNAAEYSGAAWTNKVAAAYGSTACTSGCRILVDDSLAGDGSATDITLPDNVSLTFTGAGTFTACRINAGKYSEINVANATLKAKGTTCRLIHQANVVTMQTTKKFMVRGGTYDCDSQVGASAIWVGNHSSTEIFDTKIQRCLDTTTLS